MQKTTKIATAVFCGLIPAFLYSYATGPDPRYTGAPGDSTCNDCHSGTALNGGGGSVQLTSSAGNNYTPGQQQTLTITIDDSKAKVYGFQASARLDSSRQADRPAILRPARSRLLFAITAERKPRADAEVRRCSLSSTTGRSEPTSSTWRGPHRLRTLAL